MAVPTAPLYSRWVRENEFDPTLTDLTLPNSLGESVWTAAIDQHRVDICRWAGALGLRAIHCAAAGRHHACRTHRRPCPPPFVPSLPNLPPPPTKIRLTSWLRTRGLTPSYQDLIHAVTGPTEEVARWFIERDPDLGAVRSCSLMCRRSNSSAPRPHAAGGTEDREEVARWFIERSPDLGAGSIAASRPEFTKAIPRRSGGNGGPAAFGPIAPPGVTVGPASSTQADTQADTVSGPTDVSMRVGDDIGTRRPRPAPPAIKR